MKRIYRNHAEFDLMRLLDRYARSRGISIRDQANHAVFLSHLHQKLEQSRSRGTLIHGMRTQAMFAYVAAALGFCSAIKEEDAGDLYSLEPELCAPDFRIVTLDGQEILVEVKNHHPPDPTADYVSSRSYIDKLIRYSQVFQRELYIAIYWSQWKLWSLVRSDRLNPSDSSCSISLGDALKRSEMRLLGDCTLATEPPLTFRLLSNPEKPRRMGADSVAEFTIGTAQVLAAGKVIEDRLESAIAWFLMLYGDWPEMATPIRSVGDELISIEYQFAPSEETEAAQGFACVGFLSQMLSRQYDEMTAENGKVDLLTPKRDPDELGVIIPPDFKGKTLRLWRFYDTPSDP